MNNKLKTFAAAALALGITGTAEAGMIQIASPDAGYTGATTLIPITDPNGTDVTSLTDGTLTLGFSHIREVHTVPSGGWATWSSPPNSETSTPRVLAADGYNNALNTLTITFSQALDIFGVEIEPDAFSTFTIIAEFFNGVTSVGTISQDVAGNAGARLFAADATGGDTFTSVTISMSSDFAIAQPRYALAESAVPAPATLGLLAAAIAGVGFARTRRTA